MVIDPAIERTEPGPGGRDDDSYAYATLQAAANAALERWLKDHPEVAGEIKETVHAHVHLQEREGRTREAEQAHQAAEHRHSTLLTKRDPAGHRVLGFAVGVVLLQSAMLTTIYAGLVLGESAVLARTRSLSLARSSSAGRWPRRAAADARATQAIATQKLARHIGALWQMLLPWALGMSAPTSVDRAKRLSPSSRLSANCSRCRDYRGLPPSLAGRSPDRRHESSRQS